MIQGLQSILNYSQFLKKTELKLKVNHWRLQKREHN